MEAVHRILQLEINSARRATDGYHGISKDYDKAAGARVISRFEMAHQIGHFALA